MRVIIIHDGEGPGEVLDEEIVGEVGLVDEDVCGLVSDGEAVLAVLHASLVGDEEVGFVVEAGDGVGILCGAFAESAVPCDIDGADAADVAAAKHTVRVAVSAVFLWVGVLTWG